jgi:hypothetical protein
VQCDTGTAPSDTPGFQVLQQVMSKPQRLLTQASTAAYLLKKLIAMLQPVLNNKLLWQYVLSRAILSAENT